MEDNEREPIIDMAVLEALTVIVAAATWGAKWSGRKVVLRSDSSPACFCFNELASKDPAMARVADLSKHLQTARPPWVPSRAWPATTGPRTQARGKSTFRSTARPPKKEKAALSKAQKRAEGGHRSRDGDGFNFLTTDALRLHLPLSTITMAKKGGSEHATGTL
jgi:hypothetical protein